MLKKLSNGCVALVQRYLPDPFIFCIILTIVVFIAAMPLTSQGPMDMVIHWGSGVWNLLAFSMQMALVLVLGTAFASAKPVKKGIRYIASYPKTPAAAIYVVTFVSLVACWLNWGFGLVIGALLAKEVARQLQGVDYRLLIASAYTGFVVWHAGASGSIPLSMGALGEDGFVANTGQALSEIVSTSDTIFSGWNLIFCALVLITLPIVNMKMHPDPAHTITVDPKLLIEEEEELPAPTTPAQKLEQSAILSYVIVACGVVYLVYYFANNGFNLSLDIVNLIFLILGIAFHVKPINYVNAITDAARGSAGIILQFPFYAGIMGMMVGANAITGETLAGVISQGFVSISNQVTFPVFTFLSAGIVNFFVPSGGGQWAVQGPIMMPAGLALGVKPAITGMAIAWGDAWTNMIQPFWALPALGIAGLSARDIMGYCLICLFLVGVIVCGGFIVVGLLGI
ncbi:MAG: short-chain fatty acid transporter [Clostridia bacterium]|nr:short-chain fatty acid transporter [Clostridia bacterium]